MERADIEQMAKAALAPVAAALDVRCTICGADVGERCRLGDGSEAGLVHLTRWMDGQGGKP